MQPHEQHPSRASNNPAASDSDAYALSPHQYPVVRSHLVLEIHNRVTSSQDEVFNRVAMGFAAGIGQMSDLTALPILQ
jgi:hypothetical protein